MTEHY